ncbi:MAG: SIR2 family protein, partial [Candidatus Magnetominusculus sp. LBB02]|nr:SIR2 family protein [Candidatus Magnetominusculus sp. LBB02]
MAEKDKIEKMDVGEFARQLKTLADQAQDSRFIFFLGAGCSISSGVPAAGRLVEQWLSDLKWRKTGSRDNLDGWITSKYSTYDRNNAAELFKDVIEELFKSEISRQNEIIKIVDGKDPGFGYGILAQLMSHNKYERHFNTILTTNFDDMVADALYLYAKRKPLVISHESLVDFVRAKSTLPLVLKVHGDARLAPKSTTIQLKTLSPALKDVLHKILLETAIIFVGYAGNDEGIAEMFIEQSKSAIDGGIYWVNDKLPDGIMLKWLNDNDAIWVKHLDFDELMFHIQKEFEIDDPDRRRLEKVYNTFYDKSKELKLKFRPKHEDEHKPSATANTETTSSFKSWYAVEVKAAKHKKSEPAKADEIYKEGLKKFPNSAPLMGNYASFLHTIRKDYDEAE